MSWEKLMTAKKISMEVSLAIVHVTATRTTPESFSNSTHCEAGNSHCNYEQCNKFSICMKKAACLVCSECLTGVHSRWSYIACCITLIWCWQGCVTAKKRDLAQKGIVHTAGPSQNLSGR